MSVEDAGWFGRSQENTPSLRARIEALEAEVARLRRTMVPISEDGNWVFIDGPGDVELDHGGKMRARIEALEAEVVRLREERERGDTLNAAIQYAVKRQGGIYWLAEWNEGDPGAMAELDNARRRAAAIRARAEEEPKPV